MPTMECVYVADHQYGVSMMVDSSSDSGNCDDGGVKRKRKREKLDHLTEEEKMMRRKIKNRMSAQTSRDKKKKVMTTMEIKLASMDEVNQRLMKENLDLKSRLAKSESNQLRISTLEMENELLKDKLDLLEKIILGQKSPSISDVDSLESDSEKSLDTSFEPAVHINGSQPKIQEVNKEIPMILTMLLIISLIVMVKILSHGYHLSPINYWRTKLNHHLHFYAALSKIKILHKQLDHL